MRAMVFDGGAPRLREAELPDPRPASGELLIDVHACGVCRTDLHVVDGDLRDPKRPVIPGHEIVGTVAALGVGAAGFAIGDRVGVPWLGRACGHCMYCKSGRENLCDAPGFTGYTIDGGYAERTVADARFCVHLPSRYDDVHAAPLLCAGLIGYRTLKMAGPARRIGLYGFGAAAHLVAQVARFQGRTVYAFTRPGDVPAQQLARRLGAAWAGGSDEPAPEPLDAALIFASVGALVPAALAAVAKGGVVVCGGIHMSDIPSFSYDLLWGERRIVSVANLTRDDAAEFMRIANDVQLDVEATPYPLAQANQALDDLRSGRLTGAAVLTMR
ncbi:MULTISPECIES: zinc-dependent alcohol dehydrogenase family protein [Burkholderia]|uniref:zinc-dependent alcohol dehydrogenase family protein n=1 Tax=Burkholderia TaxID=32008 RepID=UPI00075254F4|nr:MULTISPECIES: zinc-dependent alcohol dehydrogenase family protein [Burkholderia]AOJ72946.1 alcohol dehydrogenase [Burkholderia savannae]AOK49250.1 alcohol dehydrogenase [Burkholderia sp. MSMB617WGS]KVG44823.1 alcohol dehydrogenase [Burkholderia sp. MSMB0265]KVG79687.1 alcohol dehydrogenase [Burkholderia sp. MSMB2040]KVG95948.1 alcohol dehydrogenase [Burkholderia sp. MSMB2041]